MNKSLKELQSLKGKTAIVTGGAGYLGTAMCETLAELGANLVIASRDLAKCEKKCEEIVRLTDGSIKAVALELDLQLYDPKLSPVVAQTQIALGHCYIDRGDVQEARRSFERAKAIQAAHKQLAQRYTQALRELGARLHVST